MNCDLRKLNLVDSYKDLTTPRIKYEGNRSCGVFPVGVTLLANKWKLEPA